MEREKNVHEITIAGYKQIGQSNSVLPSDMVMSALECGGRVSIVDGRVRVAWRTGNGQFACSDDDYNHLVQRFEDTDQLYTFNKNNKPQLQTNDTFAEILGIDNVNPTSWEITSGGYVFRPVAKEEYEAVDIIRKKTFSLEGPTHQVYDIIEAIGGYIGGVFDSTNTLVAFTTVLPAYDEMLPNNQGFLLDMIGVSPEAQGKGLGQHAVKVVTYIAEALNKPWIKLTYDPLSSKLSGFYTGLGFQPITFYKDLYGEGYDRFLAILDLSNSSQKNRLVSDRSKWRGIR